MSSARCEIDLSPGTAMCPTSAPAGSTFVTVPFSPVTCLAPDVSLEDG